MNGCQITKFYSAFPDLKDVITDGGLKVRQFCELWPEILKFDNQASGGGVIYLPGEGYEPIHLRSKNQTARDLPLPIGEPISIAYNRTRFEILEEPEASQWFNEACKDLKVFATRVDGFLDPEGRGADRLVGKPIELKVAMAAQYTGPLIGASGSVMHALNDKTKTRVRFDNEGEIRMGHITGGLRNAVVAFHCMNFSAIKLARATGQMVMPNTDVRFLIFTNLIHALLLIHTNCFAFQELIIMFNRFSFLINFHIFIQ